jgi:ATP-dependent Clp protease ATP-binding subunit ClpB
VTDAQGHTVDFKNTVIIMTSNLGSSHLLEGVTNEGELLDSARDAVLGELRRHFRPEFLNRIDDVVIFKPLVLDEIKQIVDLLTKDLEKRLAERRLRFELTEPAKELIAREGFDPVFGARPLKRYLQHEVETRLGRALLAGEVPDGATVRVTVENGGLHVEVGEAKEEAIAVG